MDETATQTNSIILKHFRDFFWYQTFSGPILRLFSVPKFFETSFDTFLAPIFRDKFWYQQNKWRNPVSGNSLDRDLILGLWSELNNGRLPHLFCAIAQNILSLMQNILFQNVKLLLFTIARIWFDFQNFLLSSFSAQIVSLHSWCQMPAQLPISDITRVTEIHQVHTRFNIVS